MNASLAINSQLFNNYSYKYIFLTLTKLILGMKLATIMMTFAKLYTSARSGKLSKGIALMKFVQLNKC